jgi:uncharacterized protein
MIFWDSSAIVPLLVAEAATRPLQGFAARDPEMLVWWGSAVECASALARLEGPQRSNQAADSLQLAAAFAAEAARKEGFVVLDIAAGG